MAVAHRLGPADAPLAWRPRVATGALCVVLRRAGACGDTTGRCTRHGSRHVASPRGAGQGLSLVAEPGGTRLAAATRRSDRLGDWTDRLRCGPGGLAEPLLATDVSRYRWLLAHSVNAAGGAALLLLRFGAAFGTTPGFALGDVPEYTRSMVVAGLLQMPAVMVVGGLALAALGIPPVGIPGGLDAAARCTHPRADVRSRAGPAGLGTAGLALHTLFDVPRHGALGGTTASALAGHGRARHPRDDGRVAPRSSTPSVSVTKGRRGERVTHLPTCRASCAVLSDGGGHTSLTAYDGQGRRPQRELRTRRLHFFILCRPPRSRDRTLLWPRRKDKRLGQGHRPRERGAGRGTLDVAVPSQPHRPLPHVAQPALACIRG